jgi:hypothetical protein
MGEFLGGGILSEVFGNVSRIRWKAEDRGQRTEDRSQRTDDRRVRSWKSDPSSSLKGGTMPRQGFGSRKKEGGKLGIWPQPHRCMRLRPGGKSERIKCYPLLVIGFMFNQTGHSASGFRYQRIRYPTPGILSVTLYPMRPSLRPSPQP